MKTQEEIEQLAKKQKGCSKEYCDSIDEQYGYLNGYIGGYTQCQEDMVRKEIQPKDIWNDEKLNMVKEHILNHIKNQTPEDIVETELEAKKYTEEDVAEKKYTEDDIKETAYFFVSKKLAANQGILDEEIQDFIDSLNKQD